MPVAAITPPRVRAELLELERTLILSTCHITVRDNQVLMALSQTRPHPEHRQACREHDAAQAAYGHLAGKALGLSVTGRPYGHLLRVWTDADLWDDLLAACAAVGLSRSLARLLALARSNGATFLLLDADGPECPGLRRYSW